MEKVLLDKDLDEMEKTLNTIDSNFLDFFMLLTMAYVLIFVSYIGFSEFELGVYNLVESLVN